MPVLDVTKLTQPQLDRAKEVFESIEAKSLQGFAHLARRSGAKGTRPQPRG